MNCDKCGKKIESTAGVCYSCEPIIFYGPVFPCTSCAVFQSKLDREKLAKVLFTSMNPGIPLFYATRVWEDYASAIITYFKEG